MVTGCPGTGTGIASAGRWMPGARLMLNSAAASAGPVEPPLTKASASPAATARVARTIDASGFERLARDGVGRLGDRDGGVDDLDPLGDLAELLGGPEEHDPDPLLGCVRRTRGDFGGPEVGAVGVDRDRDGHAVQATQ